MTRAYSPRSTYTRSTVPPQYRDCSQWPLVDISGLSVAAQEQFMDLQNAANEYLHYRPVKPWLARARTSHRTFLTMLNRSLQHNARTGGIIGWAGFLKGVIRKPYTRRADTAGAEPPGLSGALQLCFRRLPDLEQNLIGEVLKAPRIGPHEARIAKRTVHKHFVQACRDAGLGPIDWPFNTRWKGRRAIEKFVDQVLIDNYERGVRTRKGEAIASKLDTGTGVPRLIVPELPYDVVEMDSHSAHFIGCVGITNPEGLIDYVPIDRVQLLLIVDYVSTNILGCAVVIRRECNADDILDAGYSVTAPWEPRELVLSACHYEPGGGLPSGVIPELRGCGFAALLIDNALINSSDVVLDRVVPRFGCAVNWGPVRKWMRRALVERIFKALEEQGFCRLPSTTGSHPKDSRKARNPARAAVECRVHFQLILDLIDLEIARYNAWSSEGRFGMKRLDALRQYVERPELGFRPPKLPPVDVWHPDLNITVDRGFVRGTNERPYTKYERIKYRSPLLSHSPGLISKQIIRHIDRAAIETIEAFREDGTALGTLTCAAPWCRYPHSLEMRKQVMRMVDDGRIEQQHGEDYVHAAMRQTQEQARADAKRRRAGPSKAGTLLAREQQLRDRAERARRGVVDDVPALPPLPGPPSTRRFGVPRLPKYR